VIAFYSGYSNAYQLQRKAILFLTDMMTDLLRPTISEFQQRFRGPPTLFSQAPGRINILGEHTDYTGGLSLPAAIDCWTVGAWRRRDDHEIKIFSHNLDDYWDTTWTSMENGIDSTWKKYVAGCFLLFREKYLGGGVPSGVELVLHGNIPLGKGVSSSASVELAVLNGLAALFKKDVSAMDLALLAQQVEHRFLNVKSGLLDQFACQFSQKHSAILVDFAKLETRLVPLAPAFRDAVWILVDSLVTRELTNSAYSERVAEYKSILSLARAVGRENLRELTTADLPLLLAGQNETLLRRARHIVSENERTVKALECLQGGDVAGLGRLLWETHSSLSKDYEVSHRNLDFLVDTAKTLPGVYGGRMMGGGFGGCCLFLVARSQEIPFGEQLAERYAAFSNLHTQPRSVDFVEGASAWTHGN